MPYLASLSLQPLQFLLPLSQHNFELEYFSKSLKLFHFYRTSTNILQSEAELYSTTVSIMQNLPHGGEFPQ